MATKIEKLCEQVIAARTARDAVKTQLDACESDVELAETSLSEALLAEGGKFAHAGFSFSSTLKVSWKTLKEGKDKLLVLLKKGAPELVKESVNASSLNSYLRKNEASLDEAKAGWWTEAKAFIERTESPSLSVRKAAAKKKA